MAIGLPKPPWSPKMARWYAQALRYSTYPRRAMAVLHPKLKGIRSIIDVGAGVGALTLPLARHLRRVTALEPSPAMMKYLVRGAHRLGLRNITTIEAAWGEVALKPHNALLVASVPDVSSDLVGFIKEALPLVNRRFFLVQGGTQEGVRFYHDELWPVLFGRSYPRKPGYIDTCHDLVRMGFLPSAEVFSYRFDQRFVDLAEAVDFWKEHLNLRDDRHDLFLRRFLSSRLERFGEGLICRVSRSSALIWWSV